MKKLLLLLFLAAFINSYAQFDFAGGMGISFVNNSSLEDYINGQPLSDDVATFNSAFELYLESDYSVSPKFQIGVEYVYALFSHNSSYAGIGNYDLSYVTHRYWHIM